MVKIYFEREGKDVKEFVDVNIWSLVKANILSTLVLLIVYLGIAYLIGGLIAVFW